MAKYDFTDGQLEFLAVLDMFDEPISIKIAGAVSPLPPSELLDLLRRGKALDLIHEPEQDVFVLDQQLPPQVLNRFSEINDQKRTETIFRQVFQTHLWDDIPLSARANMLVQTGNKKDAAFIYVDIAQRAMDDEKEDVAYNNLISAIPILSDSLGEERIDRVFVQACSQLCYLCNLFGRYNSLFPHTFEAAIRCANRLGDKRSKALFYFYWGVYHFTFGDTSAALKDIETGRLIFEELGDEDILIQSAGFVGLYYFIQGLNKEALDMFEKAELYVYPQIGFLYGPIYMAYSAAYTGHFDRAIGCLDFYWHLAQRMGWEPISASYRAALGELLLFTEELQAAKYHLTHALESAYASKNEFAAYCAERGLSFYYYISNDLNMASKYFDKYYSRIKKSKITILAITPWQIQMINDLEKHRDKSAAGPGYHQLLEQLMQEKNIHLKGIALRLKAKFYSESEGQKEMLGRLFDESKTCLKAASDPVQLAQTQLELARLKVNDGDMHAARILAMKARLGLSGKWEHLFPDDMRFLLEKSTAGTKVTHFGNGFIDEFVDKIGNLPFHDDMERSISNILAFTNREFRAERGALLWKDPSSKKGMIPKALKNMSASDLHAECFRSNMAAIISCEKENRPILLNNKHIEKRSNHLVPLSAICLPICIHGCCKGVLYHDNTYLTNCFEMLSKKKLAMVSEHLERYFKRCLEFNKAIEKTKKNAVREAVLTGKGSGHQLIASCQPMTDLLEQADKVAAAESAVLIMGETGVGKELLAKRIHMMSPRAAAPFITVDATTISDNLVESELFGHEKGAFTGADRQKIGRVELADKGTLFIDEVGELPKSTQAKLLRVLQEKSFIRVGGTMPMNSDFRLVVATNRNLEEEVRKNNFREDLYFRLNTIPLILPPLRERGKDIIELARYFLKRFSTKYQHTQLTFSTEDEKRLSLYHWPGNIRELENVIERSVILSKGDKIELNIMESEKPIFTNETDELVTLDELQRRYILHVLVKTGGKIYGSGGAAEILGINRGTLYSRMKKLGIKL